LLFFFGCFVFVCLFFVEVFEFFFRISTVVKSKRLALLLLQAQLVGSARLDHRLCSDTKHYFGGIQVVAGEHVREEKFTWSVLTAW